MLAPPSGGSLADTDETIGLTPIKISIKNSRDDLMIVLFIPLLIVRGVSISPRTVCYYELEEYD